MKSISPWLLAAPFVWLSLSLLGLTLSQGTPEQLPGFQLLSLSIVLGGLRRFTPHPLPLIPPVKEHTLLQALIAIAFGAGGLIIGSELNNILQSFAPLEESSRVAERLAGELPPLSTLLVQRLVWLGCLSFLIYGRLLRSFRLLDVRAQLIWLSVYGVFLSWLSGEHALCLALPAAFLAQRGARWWIAALVFAPSIGFEALLLFKQGPGIEGFDLVYPGLQSWQPLWFNCCGIALIMGAAVSLERLLPPRSERELLTALMFAELRQKQAELTQRARARRERERSASDQPKERADEREVRSRERGGSSREAAEVEGDKVGGSEVGGSEVEGCEQGPEQ